MTTTRVERVHRTVNRTLSTILQLLGIVVLALLLYGGWQVYSAASELGDALGSLAETAEPADAPEPYTYDEPAELNDGGADYFPEDYIGETNPDGTPCVGYGCTPEMDAEIDAYENEANQ